MKVRQIVKLQITISEEENERFEIIKNNIVSKEKLIRYIQQFNIREIFDIVVHHENDTFILTFECIVKN